MEILTFLAIVVILIIVISLNSSVKDYLNQNRSEMMRMRTTLDEIKIKLNSMGLAPDSKDNSANAPKAAVVPPKVSDIKSDASEVTYLEKILRDYDDKEMAKLQAQEAEAPIAKPFSEEPETPILHQEKPAPIYESIPPTSKPTPISAPRPLQKPIEKPSVASKSFMEQYPDLERFVGENLINKLGIGILVLGIAFFVKYAIDQNWINEAGRVIIGILCAGILLGVAHKLQKGYAAFSSVLIGGGLATLYFTITLAFHTVGYPLYQQQTTAFVILVFITLFAVFLSVVYNRMEIAILAILGGFGSPLMLSTGESNYIVLFTYLTLLNVGMLLLSYFKKWRAVNIVAFAFTTILFVVWLTAEINSVRYTSFAGAFFFAALFYLIFFVMNILYNLKNSSQFKAIDISLLLSNTAIFFGLAMIMLAHIGDGAYKGLFSISLGVINFLFAYYIHSRQKADRNLFYLLIGLVLTFVTLAIPLQLNGNYITLFWSVETVLLLWLSQKSGFKVMTLGSVVVAGLMIFSLFMDWSKSYQIEGYGTAEYVKVLGFLLNRMFITTLVSGGALIATFMLMRKEQEVIAWFIPAKEYRTLLLFAALGVFYAGGLLEVNYQAFHFYIEKSSQALVTYTYHALFVLSLMVLAYRFKARSFSIFVSCVATLFLLVFLIGVSSVFAQCTLNYIGGVEALNGSLLLYRWISIASAYAIGILLFRLVNELNDNKRDGLFNVTITGLTFLSLYLLSADLDTIAILITKNKEVLVDTQRAGYAVLWGICSFILMVIGMKGKEKSVRILSLVLFAITIFKLFVYDISNISEGGKIIAFILLGVLLLVMSFMYQKVKKLVIDDNYLNQPVEGTTPPVND